MDGAPEEPQRSTLRALRFTLRELSRTQPRRCPGGPGLRRERQAGCRLRMGEAALQLLPPLQCRADRAHPLTGALRLQQGHAAVPDRRAVAPRAGRAPVEIKLAHLAPLPDLDVGTRCLSDAATAQQGSRQVDAPAEAPSTMGGQHVRTRGHPPTESRLRALARTWRYPRMRGCATVRPGGELDHAGV